MVTSVLAEQTLERARTAPRSRRAVGLPEVVRVVQSLTTNVGEVDVSVLADVIQKDPVVLAKVLASARTIGFNATGAAVGSVAQAIHLIGYSRLRSLTLGCLIAQGAEAASADHRAAAALAVCSGFVAQSAAHHYTICDPEEAFVFACLRQFGRLVLTALMPGEYRAAVEAGDPFEGRCADAFGLTALEFGRRLLAEENVPPSVLGTMRVWGEPHEPGEDEVPDRLVALCDFAERLADACLGDNPQCEGPGAADVFAALALRYELALPDLSTLANGIVAQASVQLRRFLMDRGITSLPGGSVRRFHRRADEARRPRPEAPAGEVPVVLRREEAMVRVLETFEARDITVFARGGGTMDEYRLAGGSGPFFRSLFPGLSVRESDRSLPAFCLRRCENILIHDARDPKLAGLLPPWLARSGGPGAFALFPALGTAGPRALLLVAWAQPRRIAPPAGFAATLSALLSSMT